MTILVPIDTSAPSRSAVRLAALLGQDLGLDVLMLHVSVRSPALDTLAELHHLAEPVRRRGVPTRLRTTRGDVAARICEEANGRGCRWIVMGTHGDGRGSVARAVLQCSPVPVVAVRPGETELSPDIGALAVLDAAPGPWLLRLADALAAGLNARWEAFGGPEVDDRQRPQSLSPAAGALLLPSSALWADDASGATRWWRDEATRDRRPLVIVSEGRPLAAR